MTDEENYFEHDADIGIIGRGETVEACFVNAAKSMFSLMANLSQIHSQQTITFEFEEEDLELAFVTWLNQLIARAQEHNLILSDFHLKQEGKYWQGTASGEKWNENIERGIEVKGATLTMLSVKKRDHQWEARCVVDV
ncbi:archease [Aquicella lusitana]|uniref:SHS2 domain-containing protein n=1 Tax=Aquicella lusitana TaxID=254246 RepID=A0A370GT61_9COXI|nr:archease [Aquicella lusitana]RDI46887.1 SHS2 domain-containing protein [Aquicella lusitana]VVC73778.1 Protein archease [Aquicella lusitana]